MKTVVFLDSYGFWGAVSGERVDAYSARDSDYDTAGVPERLAELLQRDGWPLPYERDDAYGKDA